MSPATFQDLLIRADRDALRASLARGMLHDLRGPLQVLALLTAPSGVRTTAEEGPRLHETALGALDHLTQSLERFSQVFGATDPEPGPVLPEDVLADVGRLQSYQRGHPPVQIEIRVEGGLPPVRAVESDLRHILLSLILNAKEALAGREGRLVLAARATADDGVTVSVWDNGPGFPAGSGERWFEPFVTTREGHLGIGLTVARLLAERWGGWVAVERGSNGGAEVLVQLAGWRGHSGSYSGSSREAR